MFYLSLPSKASSRIYPDNTPGKFKVKLTKEIYLPENDWEVALSSVSFPSTLDTVVHKDVNYHALRGVDFMCGMELEMKGVKNKDDLLIGSQSYWLKGCELKYEHLHDMIIPRHGGDFWNRMISLLNRRLHCRLPRKMKDCLVEDKDYQKKRPKWPVFRWQDVGGGSYRLCIDNSRIDGSFISGTENDFYIHLGIARAFNLVVPKAGVLAYQKGFELTSLLTFEHFRDPISDVCYEGDVQRVWEIIYSKAVGLKPEGNPSDSKFLRLECSVNWYIYGLCRTCESPLHQERPLYVYSDLVQK